MKKVIFLIILNFFLIENSVFAQTFYFSYKKTPGGLMIGVEIFGDDKKSFNPLEYTYEWTLSNVSNSPRQTYNNILFTPLPKLKNSIFIDLKISKPFSKEFYFTKNHQISLPQAKVKIVKKSIEDKTMPILGKLKSDDVLTVAFKNFSSKNLNYIWEYNGIFISNEREIAVNKLREKTGKIKVKVVGKDFYEIAEDYLFIQIE